MGWLKVTGVEVVDGAGVVRRVVWIALFRLMMKEGVGLVVVEGGVVVGI